MLHCSIGEFLSFERDARKRGSFPTSPTSPRREASLLDSPGYFLARLFLCSAGFSLEMACQRRWKGWTALINAVCGVALGKPACARSNAVSTVPADSNTKGRSADLLHCKRKAHRPAPKTDRRRDESGLNWPLPVSQPLRRPAARSIPEGGRTTTRRYPPQGSPIGVR